MLVAFGPPNNIAATAVHIPITYHNNETAYSSKYKIIENRIPSRREAMDSYFALLRRSEFPFLKDFLKDHQKLQ